MLDLTPIYFSQLSAMLSTYKSSTRTMHRAVFRIHMFLGLPDPDPLVRGMDPDPNPSIIMQK
jgi:hypothetical protein